MPTVATHPRRAGRGRSTALRCGHVSTRTDRIGRDRGRRGHVPRRDPLDHPRRRAHPGRVAARRGVRPGVCHRRSPPADDRGPAAQDPQRTGPPLRPGRQRLPRQLRLRVPGHGPDRLGTADAGHPTAVGRGGGRGVRRRTQPLVGRARNRGPARVVPLRRVDPPRRRRRPVPPLRRHDADGLGAQRGGVRRRRAAARIARWFPTTGPAPTAGRSAGTSPRMAAARSSPTRTSPGTATDGSGSAT